MKTLASTPPALPFQTPEKHSTDTSHAFFSSTTHLPLHLRRTRARREYLTGFSKRKKQRELAVRTKAIGREKEEARENRKAVSGLSLDSW